MSTVIFLRGLRRALATALVLSAAPAFAAAQGSQLASRSDSSREASRLDAEGATGKGRELFRKLVDSAPDAASRAAAQRALAISFAFDADCPDAVKAEEPAIAYWATREGAEPQNAFYQEGEVANEAARICVDAGDLAMAEKYYRRGTELGLKEPEPKKNPKSLWDFRLTHALARLAARRGNKAEALKLVGDARRILDGDPTMAAAQERFFPYLTGYVALYTGDLKTAETDLTRAIAMQGNTGDPFMHCLLAMTYEKMGRTDKAKEFYQKAFDLATAHNPPAAFVRPYARKKLAS